MTRAELVLQLKQFISKKSWRREDVLCRFLLERDTRLFYSGAEYILARLVERGDGVEWFLPPRIEDDEDKRGSTLLRYRLTSKGKVQVQGWLRTKQS
jgi:hypothetical protein